MAAEYVAYDNDFSRYDDDPRMILVKIDRNNTHYYTDTRCPKCGGTNTKIISGASKAGSIFLWGPYAANKVLSQYQCNDCGHKF